ncbi:carboxypeptidase N subunit 2-like [Sycon ciliatum]|uniref:carboxypeptidase N subunit 2-like n=1 Tax=Sycon ciliatum TaxID=27933 RepID=UPI0031F64535
MRRLYDATRNVSKPYHRIRLSPECHLDLLWWSNLLEGWNGKSFFLDLQETLASDILLETDASGAIGHGAVYWSPQHTPLCITFKELYPICFACATWGHQWCSKRIRFHTDNEAVAAVLKSAPVAALISLRSDNLTNLSGSAFQNNKLVTDIDLYGNQLVHLPVGLFNATTKLETLNLRYNQLVDLPDGLFKATTELQTLDLDDNAFVHLPVGLFNATTKLENLYLSRVQLDYLPAGLFDATTRIKVMYFRGNKFDHLHAGLFKATTELESLHFVSNQLVDLPDGLFKATTKLQIL